MLVHERRWPDHAVPASVTALVWCECRGHWRVADHVGYTVDGLLAWAMAHCRRRFGCRCPEHRIGPPRLDAWPGHGG